MRRPVSSPRSRRVLVGAATAATALLITGCAELSPQTTTLEYDPADGVSAQVGAVQLTDVLLVSGSNGGTAKLSGMADNRGSAPVELTIASSEQGGQKVTIPALSAVRLDGQPSGNSTATAGPVQVSGLRAKPGQTVQLAISSAAAGAVVVQVPLLLDQYPYGTASVTHPTGATPTSEGGEGGGGAH